MSHPLPPVDPSAERRFDEHRHLAAAAARRYRSTSQADDVRQVADIALWLAAVRYDPDKGPFDRFAAVTIAGEIKKHLRSAAWALHTPRRQQEDTLAIRGLVDRTTITLGRSPTFDEIVKASGWTRERATAALRCEASRYTADVTMATSTSVPSDEDDVDVRDVIDRLPTAERQVVRLGYLNGHTQREIAEVLATTQSAVHRAVKRARRRLVGDLGANVPAG